MKARTFEEWASINRPQQQPEANEAWDAAQAALFEHADGELPLAVRVPPVSEWPHWAKFVLGEWSSDDGKIHPSDPAFVLPRPAPKWVPSLGGVVFGLLDDDIAIVGLFEGPTTDGKYGVRGTGRMYYAHKVKPFDASAIGKPWSEI